MPAGNNRRPPDDDPGFEVVDNSPPQAKKPAVTPARPVTPAKPVSKPAARKIVEDPGFEVVDAPPPKPKKPVVKVVDDDDTEEEPRPKAKTKRSRPLDEEDEDDRPRKKKTQEESRIGEADIEAFTSDKKVAKKKLSKAEKRRIQQEMLEDAERERDKSRKEWVFPGVVFGIGVTLTLVAGFIIARQNALAAIGVVVMLVFTLIECVFMIPVAIVALMAVGKAMGIEYGTLTHTIRSLAAVIAIDTGIWWLGIACSSYLPCVAWPAALVLGFVATYGLFMQFFELDAMETRISVGAINFVVGVANFVAIFALVALVVLIAGGGKHAPSNGDDFDDDPPPVLKGKEFNPPKGVKGGKAKTQPPVEDWNDDDR